MDRRVVITGLGGICGLGTDAPTIWDGLRAGRSAIGPAHNSMLHDMAGRVGCEIKALPAHDIDRKQLVTMDRFSLLAVLAAREAMRQSGLSPDDATATRMGATVGVGVCGWETIEENYRVLFIEHKNRPGIFTVPKVMPGSYLLIIGG